LKKVLWKRIALVSVALVALPVVAGLALSSKCAVTFREPSKGSGGD